MEATSKLQYLHERAGRPFSRVKFEISCDESGQWRYRVDWQYPGDVV